MSLIVLILLIVIRSVHCRAGPIARVGLLPERGIGLVF
jgi:hypothetical protein